MAPLVGEVSSLVTAGGRLYLVRVVAAGRDGAGHGDPPLAKQPLSLGLCREVREWDVKSQNLGLRELGSNSSCALQVPGQIRNFSGFHYPLLSRDGNHPLPSICLRASSGHCFYLHT